MTAHKESLIAALCYIEKYGKIETRKCKDNIRAVVQRNHYNYFTRLDKGIYSATKAGLRVLEDKDYKDIVDFYRNEVELCLK